MSESDPFEEILNLEDRFYEEGYKLGTQDGDRAGRIEGRTFGIEKGFEKFIEAGRLYGKSVVWASRLSSRDSSQPDPSPEPPRNRSSAVSAESLPRLQGGSRLEKNIITLHDLIEPDTLSTDNTDESVNDFDDRLKRAQGKAKVVERLIGESAREGASGSSPKSTDRSGASLGASTKTSPIRPDINF